MTPHGESVVGGVDQVGVVGVRAVFHSFHDAANLFVEVGDQAVVFAELVTDDFLGAWPGGEPSIASHHGLRAILERMPREVILR